MAQNQNQTKPEPKKLERPIYDSGKPAGATCPQCGRFPVPVVSSPAAEGRYKIRYHSCPCGWGGNSAEVVE